MGTGPRYNLSALRKVADITYAAFCDISQYFKAGMSERQLAWRLGRVLEKYGSEKRAFPVIVAFGEQAAEPHHVPTARRLQKGDMIKIDAGAVWHDMRGDVTRTYFFGKPTKKFTTRYQAVYAAQQKAFRYYRSGVSGLDVDSVARKYLAAQHLDSLFIHSLGHGVGRAIHQSPWVTPTRKGTSILQVGQVVTNEPGVYEEGWGGIRIEDMIEITKQGPKWMGQTPSQLREIIIS